MDDPWGTSERLLAVIGGLTSVAVLVHPLRRRWVRWWSLRPLDDPLALVKGVTAHLTYEMVYILEVVRPWKLVWANDVWLTTFGLTLDDARSGGFWALIDNGDFRRAVDTAIANLDPFEGSFTLTDGRTVHTEMHPFRWGRHLFYVGSSSVQEPRR